MKISLPPMPQIPELSRTARRGRDWSPLEPSFRKLVHSHLARQPKSKSATSTGALDRSMMSIWRMERLSVSWGSPLEYAIPYDAWRKKKGLQPIRLINMRLQDAMLNKLATYILTGRAQ